MVGFRIKLIISKISRFHGKFFFWGVGKGLFDSLGCYKQLSAKISFFIFLTLLSFLRFFLTFCFPTYGRVLLIASYIVYFWDIRVLVTTLSSSWELTWEKIVTFRRETAAANWSALNEIAVGHSQEWRHRESLLRDGILGVECLILLETL